LSQRLGAFGGPVAAGFIVDNRGWRGMWRWTTTFLAVNLVLFASSSRKPNLSQTGLA
jgi:hypothetical protein